MDNEDNHRKCGCGFGATGFQRAKDRNDQSVRSGSGNTICYWPERTCCHGRHRLFWLFCRSCWGLPPGQPWSRFIFRSISRPTVCAAAPSGRPEWSWATCCISRATIQSSQNHGSLYEVLQFIPCGGKDWCIESPGGFAEFRQRRKSRY